MKQLPLGDIQEQDGNEVLRVLYTKKSMVVVLDPLGLENPDPGAWGIALVDIAHHAARALEGLVSHGAESVPRAEILGRIKELFDTEWANRTDVAKPYSGSKIQ